MSFIKGCIFDLDGVIVDTSKYHYLAWKRLAHELGFEFTEEHNERLKGVSRMTSLDILLEVGGLHFSDEEKIKMATQKNTWYLEYVQAMEPGEILPGVATFIENLKSRGIKIALGSASKNAITILKKIEAEHWFDAVIDGNKVVKAKPDPEVFLNACRELNLSPDSCVVFEDAVAGVEAAIAGGMYVIGVGESGILATADYVIPHFEDFSYERMIEKISSSSRMA